MGNKWPTDIQVFEISQLGYRVGHELPVLLTVYTPIQNKLPFTIETLKFSEKW